MSVSALIANLLPQAMKWMEREVSKYVPIQRHSDIDHNMLVLDDGSPFAMYEVIGHRFETEDDSDVIGRFLRLNASWKQLAQDGLIFYEWDTRSLISPEASGRVYPHHKFEEPVAQWIDDECARHLIDNSLYNNRKFIGFQLREPHVILGEAGEYLGTGGAATLEEDPRRVAELQRIIQLAEHELRDYQPRRLGIRTEGEGFRAIEYSEIAEALVLIATGIWRKVPLSTGPLGESMFREDVVFDGDIIKFLEPGAPWYGSALSWRHYPKATFPGMFNNLLTVEVPLTTCHSFRCIPTEAAKSIMSRRQWKSIVADDTAAEQQDSLRVAAGNIGNADYTLGDHAFTCLVFVQDAAELGRATTKAWGAIVDGGATTTREKVLAIEPAWASVLPGNADKRTRPGYIHSRNFTAMAPLHRYETGKRVGHWGKPVCVFRTISGEPRYYHIHEEGDQGNTFISGMSGSGKTTAMGGIIALSPRCGVRTNIGYDKDHGLKVLIKALGGSYMDLGGPMLAPLKRLHPDPRAIPDPDDFAFLLRLIRGAIKRDGKGELSSEDDRKLPIALEAVLRLPPEERWLEEVCAILGLEEGQAGARLAKWCWGKELGWVFDAPEDRVDFSNRWNFFDQTTILDHTEARGPTIAITHHYSTKLLDGRRVLEYFDEVNRSMTEIEFAPIIDNSMRVIRKLGGATMLATQSPADIRKHAHLGHVVREQVANMFAFANPRGQWIDYGPDGGFGYTEKEFQIIRTLPMGEGKFLLKGQRSSQVLQNPLPEDVVAVISGKEEHTRLWDRLAVEEDNDNRSVLHRWLKERKQAQRQLEEAW
jgi:type IV secretion system protein VirB4